MIPSERTRLPRKSKAEWARYLAEWRRSGLSQAEYCTRNNLNPRSLSGWKAKLERDDESAEFIEIGARQIAALEDEGHIELFLDGIRIRLRESIDPGRLRSIMLALSGCAR